MDERAAFFFQALGHGALAACQPAGQSNG
jgi:hypothetical protein